MQQTKRSYAGFEAAQAHPEIGELASAATDRAHGLDHSEGRAEAMTNVNDTATTGNADHCRDMSEETDLGLPTLALAPLMNALST
jgi:hypothetical protein